MINDLIKLHNLKLTSVQEELLKKPPRKVFIKIGRSSYGVLHSLHILQALINIENDIKGDNK